MPEDTNRETVRRHRDRMRERGMRTVQLWVPDLRHPEVIAEAWRQSAAVARSPHAAEDQAFADNLSRDLWDADW
jgi:hypothetical protein